MGMFNNGNITVPTSQVEDEVDVVYFSVHDTVYFIGGGPPMTITSIINDTTDNTVKWVTVGYYDLNLVFRREMFVIDHLTHGEELEDNVD